MKVLLSVKNKKKSEYPIGVFDSGLGGLTVLQCLEKKLPKESFIYFGDTAHVPYGNKSAKTIIRYSENIINFFLKNKIKAVVIACNTASAIAYPELSKKYNLPIFNVVDPSVIHSDTISKTRNICIIGTQSTINSKAYSKSFSNINSDCTITEIACPLFVPIIEEGWSDSSIAKDIANIYLKPLKNTTIDTLILGCTHYPIMAETIQEVIEDNIELVFTGETVEKELQQYLKTNNYQNNLKNKMKTQFYVTDSPQKFDDLGSKFLGKSLEDIHHIILN